LLIPSLLSSSMPTLIPITLSRITTKIVMTNVMFPRILVFFNLFPGPVF
jgi:hypothetical protein